MFDIPRNNFGIPFSQIKSPTISLKKQHFLIYQFGGLYKIRVHILQQNVVDIFKIKTVFFRLVPESGTIERNFDKVSNSRVVEFRSSENYNEGISLKMDHVLDFIIRLDLRLNGNSSLTVFLQNLETKDIYFLHYITSDVLITSQVNLIYCLLGY